MSSQSRRRPKKFAKNFLSTFAAETLGATGHHIRPAFTPATGYPAWAVFARSEPTMRSKTAASSTARDSRIAP